MLIKRGIPVSPGVVSGPALVLGADDFRIPQRYVAVDAVETEIARFQSALKTVCDEISENEQLATSHLGKQYGARSSPPICSSCRTRKSPRKFAS